MRVHAPRLRRASIAAALLLLTAVAAPRAPAASAEPTPELQKQINEAIDRGQVWLRSQQKPDGSFQPLTVMGQAAYQVGVTALMGLALIAAGEPKKGPVLQKALAYLKETDLKRDGPSGARSTYGTGVLIMFLTEMYRPEEKPEEKAGRYAKAKVKDPCKLPPEIAAWIQELASWLVDVQMQDGWWRYPHTPPSDLSNTQYALLGLRAARDCGAAVQQSAFLRALQRTLDTQQKDGPAHKRIIPATKPGETEYAVGGDKARGWNYQAIDGQFVSGSMTTAAIAVLAIARDACNKPERFSGYSDELDRKVQRSVQDGFAWLDKHFAVDKNPPAGAPAWHYDYLYGLERACVYAGRDKIGRHDWYVEGATYLVSKQQKDGRWTTGVLGAGGEISPSDLADTAWALLFLERATRPTIPIPAPVVTEGG
jgi:hypothetical protein